MSLSKEQKIQFDFLCHECKQEGGELLDISYPKLILGKEQGFTLFCTNCGEVYGDWHIRYDKENEELFCEDYSLESPEECDARQREDVKRKNSNVKTAIESFQELIRQEKEDREKAMIFINETMNSIFSEPVKWGLPVACEDDPDEPWFEKVAFEKVRGVLLDWVARVELPAPTAFLKVVCYGEVEAHWSIGPYDVHVTFGVNEIDRGYSGVHPGEAEIQVRLREGAEPEWKEWAEHKFESWKFNLNSPQETLLLGHIVKSFFKGFDPQKGKNDESTRSSTE